MKEERKDRPDCFGILDEVFPMGEEGIREVRERCIDCPFRVECLREAIQTEEGLKMREEMMERMPVRGVGDWVRRWSEKKMLYRMRKKEEASWKALWSEFKSVLFSPSSFFSELSEINLRDAFTFGLITGSIGSMFSLFWKILLLEEKFPSIAKNIQNYIGSTDLMLFISFLLIPIFVIAGILFYSVLLHICLSIFGASKRGFSGTFFVICYSQAAEVLSFLPMLGGIIGSILQVYIQLVGLKKIHETSYFRVIISFIFPLAFFILSMIGAMHIFQNIISGMMR